MRTRVVDASALAAVLFGEPSGPEVAERLGDGPWLAPTLLRYELASVCQKKRRGLPAKAEALGRALDLSERLDLREVEVPPAGALELAEARNLTPYDAAYLWLAETLDARLVTLDRRLAAAAGGRAG